MVSVYNQLALLNVWINADSFLGRSAPILEGQQSVRNSLNITLQYGAELDDKIKVVLHQGPNPVIKINRKGIFGGQSQSERANRRSWLKAMQALATHIRNEFLAESEPDVDEGSDHDRNASSTDDLHLKAQAVGMAPALQVADFGIVAHKVGTMRMKRGEKHQKGVVDEHLKFIGLDNLYVCDLSIFPVSLPANPTLTLAALALRLADCLKKKPKKKLLASANKLIIFQ